MINVSSCVPTTAGIDAPVIVYLTDSNPATARDPAVSFGIANALAHELSHLPACRQRARRKTTPSIDTGSSH